MNDTLSNYKVEVKLYEKYIINITRTLLICHSSTFPALLFTIPDFICYVACIVSFFYRNLGRCVLHMSEHTYSNDPPCQLKSLLCLYTVFTTFTAICSSFRLVTCFLYLTFQHNTYSFYK